MTSLISQLKSMKSTGAFQSYIDYIRFPFFRNLESNTRIDFDYPFTVFVGKNGSGKSSTLQALFGAPFGNSVGNYWFSTHVDPIKESSEGERHCFIYSYKLDGQNAEVLKTRIRNKNDPEYWEPARPVAKYGMTILPDGKRNPAIKMNVVYKNSRSILSAFDKYFYFKDSPQDYLRRKSAQLKKALETGIVIPGPYGKDQNKPRKLMSKIELDAISEILGKKYTKGTTLYHKLFKEWGTSILFNANDIVYSEAFAGSGEMAVAIIVKEVLEASPGSLILLDEPEVSLHPKAQKNLKDFLLEQIKLKKHQVIISTHSPIFLEGLPKEAIKVFSSTSEGRFRVVGNCLPEEAFYEIGHLNKDKIKLYVEDILAKKLLEEVIAKLPEHTGSLFEVTFLPGGASSLINNIPKLLQDNDDKSYTIFDGDQKKVDSFKSPGSITQDEKNQINLDAIIKEQIGTDKISYYLDSNSDEQRIDVRMNFLSYLYKKAKYFPFQSPEQLIWNNDSAKEFMKLILDDGKTDAALVDINSQADYKEKFKMISEKTGLDNKKDLEKVLHQIFIKRWISKNDDLFSKMTQLLQSIKDEVGS